MSKVTYTITVHPQGKFLFRVENVESLEAAAGLCNDFAKLYGDDAVSLAGWTSPVGCPMDWQVYC